MSIISTIKSLLGIGKEQAPIKHLPPKVEVPSHQGDKERTPERVDFFDMTEDKVDPASLSEQESIDLLGYNAHYQNHVTSGPVSQHPQHPCNSVPPMLRPFGSPPPPGMFIGNNNTTVAYDFPSAQQVATYRKAKQKAINASSTGINLGDISEPALKQVDEAISALQVIAPVKKEHGFLGANATIPHAKPELMNEKPPKQPEPVSEYENTREAKLLAMDVRSYMGVREPYSPLKAMSNVLVDKVNFKG